MSTMSLADVARLSHVSRPVVSMWLKRPKNGLHFPSPTEDGRYSAEAVVDWLEQTQRGNNPHARRDVAIAAATSARANINLDDLLILLAAKAATGLTLADTDPEDLIDAVDALDPDDDLMFREVESSGIDALAATADELADAAWSTADAYETLLDTVRGRAASSVEPGTDVIELLASLTRFLRSETGAIVDVAGSASDVVLAVAQLEGPDPSVILPAEPDDVRAVRRRYAVHGIRPRRVAFRDDWGLPQGSVVLVALPSDAEYAFDLLDEVAMQLGGNATALVAGPASVLVDQLPAALEARRDRFLREPQRTLAAAVRLPQGLTRAAGREHLALCLMQPGAPDTTRIGDLAGRPPRPAVWQQLLDDMLAVASGVRLRAFALLRPVPTATLLAAGRSLVDHVGQLTAEWAPSAGDDAARMQHLLAALTAPVNNPFGGHAPWVRGSWAPRHATLGDACRSRQATMIPGTRMEVLPTGSTPLWSAATLASGKPDSVDLLAFTAAHPKAQLTEPGDVVFTAEGKPTALVDRDGGAAVTYPVRAIRVKSGEPFSPHAIAAAINQLGAGNNKWRSWLIPVVAGEVADADDVLARVDELATVLRERQTQVEELRRLVVRSVLPGSVAFHETRPNDAKGK